MSGFMTMRLSTELKDLKEDTDRHRSSGGDTGIFTGRSPKDKYIVRDTKTENTVWWKSETATVSDNKPLTAEAWEHCRKIAVRQLSGKKLYVVDCYSGANAIPASMSGSSWKLPGRLIL